MSGSASGDERAYAQFVDLAAVDVVVVAEVGIERVGAPTRASVLTADRRHGVDQGQELSNVVAVAAGHSGGQRDAVGVEDDVVLAAGPAPVRR